MGRPDPPRGGPRVPNPRVSARLGSLLAVGLLLVAACGNDPAGDTTSTTGPITTNDGQATTTSTGDIGLPDLVGDWDNGELFLQFADDGSYQVLEAANADPNDPVMGGFVARDGADINFVTDVFGECAGMTGVYSVAIEGGQLLLTLVDDPCQFRATRFAEPWEPVP